MFNDFLNIAGPLILVFIVLYLVFQVWENYKLSKPRDHQKSLPRNSGKGAGNFETTNPGQIRSDTDSTTARTGKKLSILGTHEASKPAKPASRGKAGAGIRIKNHTPRKIRTQQTDFGTLNQLIESGTYYHIQLGEMWNDTLVDDIYMHHKCIRELDYMLQIENVQLKKPEMVHNVPEIGGVFLGQFARLPEIKKYLITIDEFVPIKPAQHDIFQIEFSTESLVMELGDAQDKYPDLSVIGWFHTHPGHGLFLSKPDLAIHHGFFDDEFQIAMEIDSLSEELDTGFFTRNSNGQVNNSIFYKPAWLSWTYIVQHAIN